MNRLRTLKVMLFVCGGLICFSITTIESYGQLPTADFSVSPNVCLTERLVLSNTSLNADNYIWDFCEGDLFKTPSASTIATISASSNPKDMDIVKDGNNWYGFMSSRNTNSIFRIDFGTDIKNQPLSVTNLGNIGNLLSGPEQIEIIEENGNWFGLVINGTTSTLIRLSFGSDLANLPTAEQVLSSISTFNSGMDVGVASNSIVLVASNFSTNQLTVVNFGNSILNNPLPADIITTPAIGGAAGLDDLTLILINGNWYGLLIAFNSRTLYRLSFGTNLFSTPTVTTLSTPPFASTERPAGIQVDRDTGSFVGFIQTFNGNLFRCDFGNQITNTPTFSNLGNLGSLANNVNFELVKSGSEWIGFTINQSSKILSQVLFPSDCFSSIASSTDYSDLEISYSNSGTHYISLTVSDQLNNYDYKSLSINVSNLLAPDIQLTSQNICTNHDINFISQNFSNDITNYSWSFGDTQTSTDPNPTHQYSSAGDYDVSLTVTAENGCNNYAEKTISIYDEPIPDFTIPVTNPLCTNQNYLFDNASTTDPGYPVTWQWKVNSVDQSVNEDLNYTFIQPDNQSVTLTASIPGCENSITKPISTLTEGPLVDFTFPTIRCEDDVINFVNASSGSVTAYSWNFGDGNASTDVNAQNTFATPAMYDVMLSATNAAGCNNYVTKPIQIFSKPVVNFNYSNPCDHQNAKFTDATTPPTDSNLSGWLWNFGDGSSTSLLKNPDHLFVDAGDYSVSLTATTSASCSATLQKSVTIHSTPIPDFTFTSPCEDVLVNFTGTSTGTAMGWDWQIGNLFYSVQNPSHTFANPGSYEATVAVTADNDCIGTVTKNILVPTKLSPNFTVLKNCTYQETIFTDATNDTADPITDYHWAITSNGTADGSPATFTFSSTGNKSVKLTVNTVTGCEYFTTKTVNIISAPQASFTASPETGGAPLTVQFTNTSSGATAFVWKFTENAISTNPSPDPFTYTELGEYSASLTAYNAQECSHTFNKTISVVNPIVEVELNDLELQQFQNGTVKPALTIYNNGNVPLNNLALFFDISGSIVREYIGVSIPAHSSLDYVVKFELPPGSSIKYFCVEADVNDIEISDNKVCLNLEDVFSAFVPYPNPASDQIHVDWISNEQGMVTVTLVNAMGREVKNFKLNASEGFNPFTIDTEGLSEGVYLVWVSFKGFSKTYRILILQ